MMLIPKNDIKYKSVRHIKYKGKRKLIRSLMLDCYYGYLPMKCNKCHLSKDCWFCGLKEC